MDSTGRRIRALISAIRSEVSSASCEIVGCPMAQESLDNADELLVQLLELVSDPEIEELDFGV